MATRIRLELDPETFGRLIESAGAERRPTDWQAEIILRRALGTWEESRTGYDAARPRQPRKPITSKQDVSHAAA